MIETKPTVDRNGIKHCVRCHDCGKYQDEAIIQERIKTSIQRRCQFCGSRETHWERYE
jgi:hypothetical protein